MTIYFNSKEQIKGDKAFNEKQYDEAFRYYNEAIEKLAKIASKNQYDHHIFNDNATHALADVISAKCYAFFELKNINASEAREFWIFLKDKLDKLSINWDVLKTYHEKNIKTQTNLKNVHDSYETAILACEDISDIFADKNLYQEALVWMERSINLRKQYHFSIPMQLSNGYLNLLYQQYLVTKDTDYLKVMEKYINELKPTVTKNISLENLEFLSHEFMMVVILSPEKINAVKVSCENMMRELIKEDITFENDAFIVEVKESIKKATRPNRANKKQELNPADPSFSSPFPSSDSRPLHQNTGVSTSSARSVNNKRKAPELLSGSSTPHPTIFSNNSSTTPLSHIIHQTENMNSELAASSVVAKEISRPPRMQNPLRITPKAKTATQNGRMENPIIIRPKVRVTDSNQLPNIPANSKSLEERNIESLTTNTLSSSSSLNNLITELSSSTFSQQSLNKQPTSRSVGTNASLSAVNPPNAAQTKRARTNEVSEPGTKGRLTSRPSQSSLESNATNINVSISSISMFKSSLKKHTGQKKSLKWSSQLEQTHLIPALEGQDNLEHQENTLLSKIDTNIPAFQAFYDSIMDSVKQDENAYAFILKIMGNFLNYNHNLDEIKKFQSSVKDKHHVIAIDLYYTSLKLNPHQPEVRKELQTMINAPEIRRYLKGHPQANMLSQIENILNFNSNAPTFPDSYVQFEVAVANCLSELEVNREKISDAEAFINEMVNYIAQKSTHILGKDFEKNLIINYYKRLSNPTTANERPQMSMS